MIITIVGFGSRGLHSLCNVINNYRGRGGLHVNIVSPYDFFVTGARYSKFNNGYLLHKPIGMMEVEYYKWLCAVFPEHHFDRNAFTPRFMYGQYLLDKFEKAKDNMVSKKITHNIIHDLVNGIISIKKPDTSEDTLIITTSENSMIRTDKVIISTGRDIRAVKDIVSVAGNLIYCGIFDVWSKDAFALHQSPTSVCYYYNHNYPKSPTMVAMLGSGLSAVELIYNMLCNNFSGKMYCISNSGRFSQPHGEHGSVDAFLTSEDVAKGLVFLVKKVKKLLRKNQTLTLTDIVSSIDADELWPFLPSKDKERFMRHIYYKWLTLACTVPQDVHNVLRSAVKEGRVIIVKGEVYDVSNINDYDVVYYSDSDSKGAIFANVVVNCDEIYGWFKDSALMQSLEKNKMAILSGPEYKSCDDRIMLANQVFGRV